VILEEPTPWNGRKMTPILVSLPLEVTDFFPFRFLFPQVFIGSYVGIAETILGDVFRVGIVRDQEATPCRILFVVSLTVSL